jgi:hypothetical protein
MVAPVGRTKRELGEVRSPNTGYGNGICLSLEPFHDYGARPNAPLVLSPLQCVDVSPAAHVQDASIRQVLSMIADKIGVGSSAVPLNLDVGLTDDMHRGIKIRTQKRDYVRSEVFPGADENSVIVGSIIPIDAINHILIVSVDASTVTGQNLPDLEMGDHLGQLLIVRCLFYCGDLFCGHADSPEGSRLTVHKVIRKALQKPSGRSPHLGKNPPPVTMILSVKRA